jgi:phosphoglycolate phosphatase-like HAD superfamily hydrolase
VNPAAYFLDFDHTLFHTDQFFHVDVRNSFLRFGIDPAKWEESYAAVWPTGYSLEKHAVEAARRSGGELPVEAMKRVLRDSFSNLDAYVFPDVVPFLQRAKKSGAPLYLVSFGDPEWQRYKVSASHLSSYFDGLFLTSAEGGKARLILDQAKRIRHALGVVDNNPAELDSIKDLAPQTRTFWMNRVPDELRVPRDELSRLKFLEARGYLEKKPRHQHILCHTLEMVWLARGDSDSRHAG